MAELTKSGMVVWTQDESRRNAALEKKAQELSKLLFRSSLWNADNKEFKLFSKHKEETGIIGEATDDKGNGTGKQKIISGAEYKYSIGLLRAAFAYDKLKSNEKELVKNDLLYDAYIAKADKELGSDTITNERKAILMAGKEKWNKGKIRNADALAKTKEAKAEFIKVFDFDKADINERVVDAIRVLTEANLGNPQTSATEKNKAEKVEKVVPAKNSSEGGMSSLLGTDYSKALVSLDDYEAMLTGLSTPNLSADALKAIASVKSDMAGMGVGTQEAQPVPFKPRDLSAPKKAEVA